MASESATARIFLAACLFFLPIFFSHHVVAATSPPPSFSFDFSNPSKYDMQDIRFEGDAVLNGGLIDLNSVNCNYMNYFCSGRMSYNHPVFLYDDNTRELASFVTTFTFAINMFPNTTTRGDGMAFFLSGYPSRLLPSSGGNFYGLKNKTKTGLSGEDRFVAIEFDTFYNPDWDTISTDHIGIDLSSMASITDSSLPSNLSGTMMATITFDNATRILEATLHFGADRSLVPTSVKAQLDLDALLPPVVSVGFSAGTGLYSELHQILSWSFSSSMAAKETPTGANPEQGPVLGIKGRYDIWLIIGAALMLMLALLLAFWSILSWRRLKKRTRDSFGTGSRLKQFKYRDLYIATERFSDKNKIGAGSFGEVYSGSLNREPVAVKRILKDSRGEFKDFLAELGAIGRTGHRNVVRLEGWCCSISNFMFWCIQEQQVKLFLVYELVPNGNLHQHLHSEKQNKKREVLSWSRRYNIVKGLCSALHYLHHQCSPHILHRDIKPQNILLDNEFNAKLGDFGLSRVAQYCGETSVQTEIAAGTNDYMDPLCKRDGQVNLRRSSDVYSFGIVLLEIAHGENDRDLVQKLRTDRPGTFAEDAADKKLAGHFDRTEMERVIVLGLRCSERHENQRPSLIDAKQFLENGGELRAAPTHEYEPHTDSISLA